jgi:hypothetical protein
VLVLPTAGGRSGMEATTGGVSSKTDPTLGGPSSRPPTAGGPSTTALTAGGSSSGVTMGGSTAATAGGTSTAVTAGGTSAAATTGGTSTAAAAGAGASASGVSTGSGGARLGAGVLRETDGVPDLTDGGRSSSSAVGSGVGDGATLGQGAGRTGARPRLLPCLTMGEELDAAAASNADAGLPPLLNGVEEREGVTAREEARDGVSDAPKVGGGSTAPTVGGPSEGAATPTEGGRSGTAATDGGRSSAGAAATVGGRSSAGAAATDGGRSSVADGAGSSSSALVNSGSFAGAFTGALGCGRGAARGWEDAGVEACDDDWDAWGRGWDWAPGGGAVLGGPPGGGWVAGTRGRGLPRTGLKLRPPGRRSAITRGSEEGGESARVRNTRRAIYQGGGLKSVRVHKLYLIATRAPLAETPPTPDTCAHRSSVRPIRRRAIRCAGHH